MLVLQKGQVLGSHWSQWVFSLLVWTAQGRQCLLTGHDDVCVPVLLAAWEAEAEL